MHTVSLLQEFQTRKRKFYPAKEVQAALELMRNELGYINSHRGDDLTAEDNGFFFRFLEQAAAHLRDLSEAAGEYFLVGRVRGIEAHREAMARLASGS